MANSRIPVIVEQRDRSRGPLISIFNTVPQPNVRTYRIFEQDIRRHSNMIAAHIDGEIVRGTYDAAADKTVTLSGISRGATLFIFDEINEIGEIKYKDPRSTVSLRIKVHNLPLVQGIAIWHAVQILDIINPVQNQIEPQLRYIIAHNKMTPDEMIAVARAAYQFRNTTGLWNMLLQQIGYDCVNNDKYSVAEIKAFNDAAKTVKADIPELLEEMEVKIKSLWHQKQWRDRQNN